MILYRRFFFFTESIFKQSRKALRFLVKEYFILQRKYVVFAYPISHCMTHTDMYIKVRCCGQRAGSKGMSASIQHNNWVKGLVKWPKSDIATQK